MEKLTENLGIFVSFPLLMLWLLSVLDNEENWMIYSKSKDESSWQAKCQHVFPVNSIKGTQKTCHWQIYQSHCQSPSLFPYFCHSIHETTESNLAVLPASTLILSSCLLIAQVFRWHRHLPLKKASYVSLQWVNPRPMGHMQHKLT